MRCPTHGDRVVTGRCGVCGEHFCGDCLSPGALGDPVCTSCAPALARRAAEAPPPAPRTRLLLPVIAVALCSAVVTALLLMPRDPAPAPDDSDAAWRAAWGALEETGLALELFKLREGRYPDRLDELVPGDLSEIPRDPFAGGAAPLIWGVTRGQPAARLLYSLGPDRIDQRGAPFDPLDRRGDLVYPVR